MSWGLRSERSKSMGSPSWSDGVKDILEAEAVKTRVIFTSRHFILLLVLWILLDWRWRADAAQLTNASKPTISGAKRTNASQLNVSRAQLMNDESELNVSKLNLVPESWLNVTLPAGIDLAHQNKTVKNDNVPMPVYVCVPILTAAISAFLIYGFCAWRLKLIRRRMKIMEKQDTRRRRSSLKPGSSERGKKFGLTRAVGPDGDPLIIPTAKVLGLARTLDDVEHLVLDYSSFDNGDSIPEKHTYKVKEVAYDISVNPMFNCLQSGACGYVLGGGDKAATSPPGTKKPGEGPDDDSDSDGGPKKRTSKNLSLLKKASTTALPGLSRHSAEFKSKEDPLRRSLANKSIVKEIQNEAKGEEESAEGNSDDASPVASSDESLGTESYSAGTSEQESDGEAAKEPDHDIPKSPTASRLSKTTSASDSMTTTRSTPTPGSLLAKASANPKAKGAVSAGNSPSPESGEESTRSSSVPRASKATVSGRNPPDTALTERTSKTAAFGEASETSSPESSVRKPPTGPVSPTFSSVATSDEYQRSGSSKKADWDPTTVPERSSFKKSPGKSQGPSPDDPSSPSTSSSTRNPSRRRSDSGSQKRPM